MSGAFKMTNLKRKCHAKALSENLELGLIGGLMASVIDTFWCITDMMHNGIQAHYLIITAVLIISSIILSVALIRHHKNNVKQEIGAIYVLKKDILKIKQRRSRRERKI